MAGTGDLVDRERELAAIASVLDAAGGGVGRVLLIEGPAGIGKTELVRRTGVLARDAGFTVLTATAAVVEQEIPYGVVRQWFERPLARASAAERAELLSRAAALARCVLEPGLEGGAAWPRAPGPSPGDGAGGPGADPGAGDPSFRVDHGLYWLSVNLATRAPVVLALDDVQWADAASVRFVTYLARRIDDLPIALVVSAPRSRPGAEPSGGLAALDVATVLRPGPLGAEAASRVARAWLGERADEAFCRACQAAAGGNPLLLREVLRKLTDSGIDPVAANAGSVSELGPAGVSRLVLDRLRRRSATALRVARAVAVLGADALVRQVALLSGIRVDEAAAVVDELAADEILASGRPVGFVHPLVRTAVYASMSGSERSALHRRAAELLAAGDAPDDRIAAHLLSTEPSGDRWTVSVLRRAARRALEIGAPRGAARALRRALDEPPHAGERAAVLQELGEAELRLDAAAAVEHLRSAFELHREPVQRAGVCVPLLSGLMWTDRVQEAVGTVGSAVERVRDADPELALRLEAELVTALRTGIATSPIADERLGRWRTRVEGRTPAERVLAVHLAVSAGLTGGDADETAALALRALGGGCLLEEQPPESIVPYVPLYQLVAADRHLTTVERLLDLALRRASEAGSQLGFVYASIFRAHLYRMTGRLADAEADAAQGLDVAVRHMASRWAVTGAVDPLVDALAQRGKLDDADRVLASTGLDGELADSVPARCLLASRARLRLRQGRPRDAVSDLLSILRREERSGPANLFLTPHRALAAYALARLGDRPAAAAMADDAVARARTWGAAPMLGSALRLAGLVHGGDRGLTLLAESTAVLERSADLVARAAALTSYGSALRRAGRRADARDALRSGLDLAYRCGADVVAARAAAELLMTGARPRRPALTGVEALTPGERRVCQLAAAGKTNRDIAQALFVTPRTVEVHLTHAYQKLGIASRDRLHFVLGDVAPAPAAAPAPAQPAPDHGPG